MLVHRFPRTVTVPVLTDLDRIFDSLLSNAGKQGVCTADTNGSTGDIVPALNVWEDEEAVHVEAELPGVDPSKIDVQVHGDMLTLSGTKEAAHEEKRRNYHRIERFFGSFQRQITLPEAVDGEKISAEYKHGVLCVTLKKKPGATTRKIPVVNRN